MKKMSWRMSEQQGMSMQAGDVIDMHQYVGPNAPLPTLRRAAVLGEFGGLGLRLEGHVWIPEDSFSYQLMTSPAELEVSSTLSTRVGVQVASTL